MSALGETLNIMTLGGLALAVGILVDDATVEIENINRNLEQGKETETAILDGAAQIAVPAFVSTLAICIVFVPMFFLSGVAQGNHARLSTIVPGRDFGNEIEVLGGLPPGRQLVDNPPDSLVDGQEVRIGAPRPPAGGKGDG
jgi:hypothetical protein